MNWNEYKEQLKQSDPICKQMLEVVETEAAIISTMIKQRAVLGLSHRDLATHCEIPHSSIARIESSNTTPKLDTLLCPVL